MRKKIQLKETIHVAQNFANRVSQQVIVSQSIGTGSFQTMMGTLVAEQEFFGETLISDIKQTVQGRIMTVFNGRLRNGRSAGWRCMR